MAWIVKDRRHEQIPTRDEPYLTDRMKDRFERELIPRYPERRGALLPICQEIQHEHHCLPYQALTEVAGFLGVTFADVLDTVTFYEEFTLEPTGTHMIQLCRSISCELCGCNELSRRTRRKLDILPGETTEDGKFTLMEIECIGACDFAPAAIINEQLTGPLSWRELEAKIDELAEQ